MSVSITTAETNLLDNAGYEANNSLSEAKAFATAAKQWLILRPGSVSNESSSLTLNTAQVQQMLNDALAFIRANNTASGTSRVKFLSVERMR